MQRILLNLLLGFLLVFIFEAYGLPLNSPSEKELMFIDNFAAINVDPTCENKTFCENALNYPTRIVHMAILQNPYLRYHANLDEMVAEEPSDNEPEEEPLCLSDEQLVFPKIAKNKDSQWMFIVNHEKLTQSVRIELCLEERKPCKVIEGFAEGYITRCKQKYIYRQLLAVASNGCIDRYSFQFPASCCCHIEFQGDRFLGGIGDDP